MKLELNSNVDGRRLENKTILEHSAIRGFTLIEVLIAMFILAIAIFAIISTTPLLIRENASDRMATTATTLAKDKMESLKSQSHEGYSGLTDGTDYPPSSPSATDSFYTRTWDITADSPAANMTTIAVTVSWSWRGSPKDVSLKTIVGQ